MVYPLRGCLVSVAIAFAVLQTQQTLATPLRDAPVTERSSYDLSDKNFPGRGTEIEDDGTCTVIVPKNPTKPNLVNNPTVPPVRRKGLLASAPKAPAEPVYTKVVKPIMSVQTPPEDSDTDAYLYESEVTTGSHKLEADSSIGTSQSEPNSNSSKGTSQSESSSRSSTDSYNNFADLEAYLGAKMELKLKNLPTFGVYTPTPWGGSNWPTYQDSINFVWNKGQPSATVKYATAFGLNVKSFMGKVSAHNGIDSRSNFPKCKSDKDCSPDLFGSTTACGIRINKKSGYCIPTWYGICHAWTPAAILEPEPKCSVTYNGVTFQPMDIKALITDVYDVGSHNMSTVMVGVRYNRGEDSLDEYGGHTNPKYRDMNPDPAYEVWNQPVIGFKVCEQTAMTTQKAAETFYGLQKYPWNDDAKSIVYVKSRLSWINETLADGGLVSSGNIKKYTVGKTYDYVLELNDAEEIIGSEWLYDSNDVHPDFLWLPTSKIQLNTTTSFGLSYANAKMLLNKAIACSTN